MTESKRARSRKEPEEQEQLTVVTLSDEILDDTEPGSPEGAANGSNRGPAFPKQPLPPSAAAPGGVHRGCWVSFEVESLLPRKEAHPQKLRHIRVREFFWARVAKVQQQAMMSSQQTRTSCGPFLRRRCTGGADAWA